MSKMKRCLHTALIVLTFLGVITVILLAIQNNSVEWKNININNIVLLKNTMNTKEIAINFSSFKYNQHINVPSLIGIGAQKCGTGSMLYTLRKWPEVIAQKLEFHYWDNIGRKDGIKSFDYIVNLINKKKQQYIFNYKLSFIKKYFKHNLNYNINSAQIKSLNISYELALIPKNKYFIEKTPIYVIFPHIAKFIVQNYVPFGTKLFVMIRNPIKRYISGYFHDQQIHHWNSYPLSQHLSIPKNGLTGYIESTIVADEYFNAFLKNITYIYNDAYGEFNDEDEKYNKLAHLYSNYLYWITNKYSLSYLYYINWLRGCYSLQLLHWINYTVSIHHFNSFKIIQSEQMYQTNSFRDIMINLRCYLHFNDNEYNDNVWMERCTRNDSYFVMHFGYPIKMNSKTKQYIASDSDINLINSSYDVCNAVLRDIIDYKYSYTLLTKWEWNLWDLNY